MTPTLWAHFENGELVNVEERMTDLCCSPAEAVRYEALSLDGALIQALRQRAFIDVAAWLEGDADMALAVRHIRCNVNDPGGPGNGTALPLPVATAGSL